jgi:hypothetical protein
MPFTPAHAAIVLPAIRWRYFSATALIAGSMAPDFEDFITLHIDGKLGHSIPGLFLFDIPMVIFLSFVFHLIVKKNFVDNLPIFFQRKLQEMRKLDFPKYFRNHFLIFVFSALIGAASHLFWDSFTHNHGFFASRLPFYKTVTVYYDGVKYPLFYALQNISSLVGLLIVLLYMIFKKDETIYHVAQPQLAYWFSVFIISLMVVSMRFVLLPDDYNLGNLVVSIVSGFLLSLVILGFINFNRHGKKITMGTSR